MQVRKYDERENLIFAHIINTGMFNTASYDVVYDKDKRILHIYDDCSHNDTSITNNTGVKHDILKAIGYADNPFQSFINKIGKKEANSRVRMIIYILGVIWEVKPDTVSGFLGVADESLLYKPFTDKVREYEETKGKNTKMYLFT